MLKINVARLAETDLQALFVYIASQSYEEYADAFLEKIFTTFELLAENPKMGANYVELGEQVRMFPIDKVNVFYSIDEGKILQIYRVRHSALNPDTLAID